LGLRGGISPTLTRTEEGFSVQGCGNAFYLWAAARGGPLAVA